MPDVRTIGFWVGEDQPDLPDPADFVDPTWDAREREVVADYLRGGKGITAGQGCSTCRICGEPNGFGEFADGVYLWPEGLAHYVSKHSVRLPDDFVQHALAAVTDGRIVSVVDHD